MTPDASIKSLPRGGSDRLPRDLVAAFLATLVLLAGAVLWIHYLSSSSGVIAALVVVVAAAGFSVLRWRAWSRFAPWSRASFRELVEQVPAIVYAWDLDRGTCYFSPRVTSLLGFSPEECAGGPAFLLSRLHPRDRAGYEAARDAAELSGEPFEHEYRLKTRDGGYLWVRDDATLVTPRRWQGVMLDITAQKEAEASYRLAMEAAGMGTWDWNIVEDRLLWSREIHEGVGISPAVLDYETFLATVIPEDRERVRSLVAAALANRDADTYESEYRFIDPEGKTRWWLAKGRLTRDAAGTAVRLTGITYDITDRRLADEELRRSEARFRALVQNAADLIVIADQDAILRYVSPAFESMLGYPVEIAVGKSGLSFAAPDDFQRVASLYAETARTPGARTRFDVQATHADGSLRWLEVVLTNHLDQPEILGIVANVRDVTESQLAEQRLREAETKYRTLVEQSAAVIYVDEVASETGERVTRFISPQLQFLLGFSPDEWIEDPGLWAKQLHPDDRERAQAEVIRTSRLGEPFRLEYRLFTRAGNPVWVRDEAIPVEMSEHRLVSWHGVLHDVTARKTLEARLSHQAFHDALTGLPNRLYFNDRLHDALEQLEASAEVAILFVDLDRFKLVNDSLGHDAGDLLLEEVGTRFQRCLEPSMSLARFGGDEFTVLLNVGSVKEATDIAERLLGTLREPFRISGREVFATASIGLALSSRTPRTPGDLLRAADTALYQAKGSGRAAIAVYEPGMSVVSHDSLTLEAELRHALARGEFWLYFQPIVDLSTGRVNALEALLRWNHPARGVLAPSDFLDLAEETDLIVPIGQWTIEESCRLMHGWNLPGELTVNVNLSARQLHSPELTRDIHRALEMSGLKPGRLQLEISEKLLVEELRATAGTLTALKALGVRLAIDDFGAGASSLASLRELPVDLLKLDQSFIRPAGGMADEAIVTAVTALAHTLGMRVTAEGVENSHQLAIVRLAGCDDGQGFLFGRPVSSERVPSLFHEFAQPTRFPEIFAHPHSD